MGGSSLFLSSIKEFDMFVKSGKACSSNRQESPRFEVHHEEEWCLLGNEVNDRVTVCKNLAIGKRSVHFMD